MSDKHTLSQAMKRELRECLRCGISLSKEPKVRLCGRDYTARLLEDRPNGAFMVQAKPLSKGEKSFMFKVDVHRCTKGVRQMMLHEALEQDEEELGICVHCGYEGDAIEEMHVCTKCGKVVCSDCMLRDESVDPSLVCKVCAEERLEVEEITVLPTAGKTKAPEVVIPLHVYSKIVELCLKSGAMEVAWFGTIEMRNNEIHIDEVYLPRQEVGVVTAEITGIAEIANKFIQEGRIDDCERLRFWGHCHPGTNLPAPSKVDLDTYEQLSKDCPTFLMGIFSSDGAKVYFSLRHHGLDLLLPWRVVTSAGSNFPDFAQKVRPAISAPTPPILRAMRRGIPLPPHHQF